MPGDWVYGDTLDRPIHDRAPLLDAGWPKMAFIEHRFAGDPTNWWVPNHAGVEAMLRSSGMRVTARPADEIYLCEPDPLAGSAESDSEAQLRSAAAAVGVVERPPVT
jgi:tRNA (mo5U34)-methyltransferase